MERSEYRPYCTKGCAGWPYVWVAETLLAPARPASLRRVSPTPDPQPRVRDFDFICVVEGQDGHLAWGYSYSSVAAAHVPFAWAISSNNKTIIGANNHGNFQMTVMSPDRIEMCYSHTGLDPSSRHAARWAGG